MLNQRSGGRKEEIENEGKEFSRSWYNDLPKLKFKKENATYVYGDYTIVKKKVNDTFGFVNMFIVMNDGEEISEFYKLKYAKLEVASLVEDSITEEVVTEEVVAEEVVLNGEVLETIEGEIETAQPNVKAYDTENEQGFNLIDNDLGQQIEFYCEHNGTEIIPFLQSLNLCSYEERQHNGDKFAHFDEDELRAAFNPSCRTF